VVPILMGWLYRIPVVVTEHSSAFALRTLTRIGVLEARFAMRRAKMVMPVSNALREHIEAYRIRGRFAVVPNAVDTTAFYPGEGTAEPPRPGGQRRLLTVALLTPVKGIPLLLQALRVLRERVPGVELDIVGDGPNRSEYQRLSASLGLSHFVHFWGLRTKDEVAVFMRRADVFVLASVTENLPCAVLEAMCCGLPIVATRVGGLPEVVTADRGRLVISRRPDDLAGAMQEVLRSRTAYSRPEIAGYARQTFSYEAVGRRLDNIYRSVLK